MAQVAGVVDLTGFGEWRYGPALFAEKRPGLVVACRNPVRSAPAFGKRPVFGNHPLHHYSKGSATPGFLLTSLLVGRPAASVGARVIQKPLRPLRLGESFLSANLTARQGSEIRFGKGRPVCFVNNLQLPFVYPKDSHPRGGGQLSGIRQHLDKQIRIGH